MTNKRSIEKRRKTLTKIAKELTSIYARPEWQAAETGISPSTSKSDQRKIQSIVGRGNSLLRLAKEILDAYLLSNEPEDLLTENILAKVLPQTLLLAKLAKKEGIERVQIATFDAGGYGRDATITIGPLGKIEFVVPFSKKRAREFVDAASFAGKPLIAVDYINEKNFKLLPNVQGSDAEQNEEFLEILKVAKAKGVEVVVVRFDVREYFSWLDKNNLQDSPENEKGFRVTLAAPACFQALDRAN